MTIHNSPAAIDVRDVISLSQGDKYEISFPVERYQDRQLTIEPNRVLML